MNHLPNQWRASLFVYLLQNLKLNSKINGNQTRNTQIEKPVTSTFLSVKGRNLPSLNAMLESSSMVCALNRRVRMAFSWLPVRPAKEGNAILDGLLGFDASIEKAGLGSDHFFKPVST